MNDERTRKRLKIYHSRVNPKEKLYTRGRDRRNNLLKGINIIKNNK